MSNAEQIERDRNKVGEIRPSQLLFNYGVGAILDLPALSVIVMGLDDWPENPENIHEIVEDRLLRVVRGVVGYGLQRFLTPPTVMNTNNPFDRQNLMGVPVATFPRWMVCPSCQLLASLNSGLFELKVDAYHPDRSHYVHKNCNKVKEPTVVPARFLVACENGHLDDFPWIEFVHGNIGNCKGPLRLFEVAPSGEARDLIVKCERCDQSRQLAEAFGQVNREKMPICRGRRPHLRDYEDSGCDKKMRPIVLGASSMWFPVVFSSIAIPASSDKIAQLIQQNWSTLRQANSKEIVAFMRNTGQLGELSGYTDAQIWEAIGRKRKEDSSEDEITIESRDLKEPEWQVLTQHNPEMNSHDFRLRPVDVPNLLKNYISQIVLVERMREVRAFAGFTRLESPGEFSEAGSEDELEHIAPIKRRDPRWLPAVEVRGEGIFMQFDEAAIEKWLEKQNVKDWNGRFFDAHVSWRKARYIEDPGAHYPGIRYIMLHSFAHTLIRQLAMESGYSAASLRERIYSRPPEDTSDPMAGILIYTSASDSEGTLGGLVKLGEPESLERHIQAALEAATLCASDPTCAENPPSVDGISLHAAACHACLFVPETSCERGNRYLDRSVLVRTFARNDLAFFDVEMV